jgi:cytochrome P450
MRPRTSSFESAAIADVDTGPARTAAGRSPAASQPKSAPRLPLHRSLPPLLRRDLLRLFDNAVTGGPLVRLDPMGFRLLQVNAEPLMREILLDKGRVYRKGSLMRRLGAITGEGLLINDGELWKRHRRLANPALAAGTLPRYVPAMRHAAEQTITRWRVRNAGPGPLDLQAELSRTTLESLLDSIFGIRFDARLARVSGVIHNLLDEVVRQGSSLAASPASWPTSANRRFRRRIAEANSILDEIIDTRAQALTDDDMPVDLLGQWLLQRRRDSEHFSAAEMRDELMTMLIAGHHSLAIALAWALYHVARDADLQVTLRAEADAAEPLGSMADLDGLPLIRGVLLETLRLYPQPPILLREATAPHALGGYRIRAGDQLLLNVLALHRDPALWPDPAAFRAERHVQLNTDAMMKAHHLGFGGGPRSCIGRRFALLEGAVLVVALIREFQLRPADPASAPVPPRFAGMMVPAAPLHVVATPC